MQPFSDACPPDRCPFCDMDGLRMLHDRPTIKG
jgi:hypothetical protein